MSEKTLKQIERKYIPSRVDRFWLDVNPAAFLGDNTNISVKEKKVTVITIFIFSLAIGILSTVMFFNLDTFSEERYILAAVMSISWFVFLNFSFLVAGGVKMFNILLFIALISATAVAVTKLPQDSVNAKLGISIIAVATVPLLILLPYYFYGEPNKELSQMRAYDKNKKAKDEIEKFTERYKKQVKEEVRKEMAEDINTEGGIKNRIASSYIDSLDSRIRKEIMGNNKKDKDKEEKKKKNKNTMQAVTNLLASGDDDDDKDKDDDDK